MTEPQTGLLIVNADDFGISPEVTDSIVECFRAGAISSATAMVWMGDSERAAELARELELPIGLHLNLIEPFTASNVPDRIAATQLRVVEHLSSRSAVSHMYHPWWAREFERCIADQLGCFTRLYGRPPTHIDGHQHMHLALNALCARALRGVRRCRRPFSLSAAESPASRRLVRLLLHRIVRSRFLTTDCLFSIRALHPALGGSGIDERLEVARTASVEVPVHPGWQDELAVLRSPEWRARVGAFHMASFEALGSRR